MKPTTRTKRALTLDRKESKQIELFERSEKAKQWIEGLLKESLSDDLHKALQDGVILCRVINAIKPDMIKKWHSNSALKLKALDNIQYFLNAAETLGVAKTELFLPLDLYEKKNILLVVRCIHSLSILASKQGLGGGGISGAQDFIDNSRKDAIESQENSKQQQKQESSSSSSDSESEHDEPEKEQPPAPVITEEKVEETKEIKEEEHHEKVEEVEEVKSDQTHQEEPQQQEEVKPEEAPVEQPIEEPPKEVSPPMEEVKHEEHSEQPQQQEEVKPEEAPTDPQPTEQKEEEVKSEEPKEETTQEENVEQIEEQKEITFQEEEQQDNVKKEKKRKKSRRDANMTEEEKQELQKQIDEVKKQIAEQQAAREEMEQKLLEVRTQVKTAKDKLKNHNVPFEDPSIVKGSLETKIPEKKMWAKKFYVLDTENKTFFYYNAAGDASPAGEVPLVNSTVYAHVEKKGQDKPMYFNIRTHARDFLIRGATKEEKEHWVKMIKSCITKDDSKPKSGSARAGSFLGKTTDDKAK